jgi:hypothetical protein
MGARRPPQGITFWAGLQVPYSHVICLPCATPGRTNEFLPIGLAIAPSERKEVHELFGEGLEYFKIDGFSDIPLLGDHGAGPEACDTRQEHFPCFRHILEKLGKNHELRR